MILRSKKLKFAILCASLSALLNIIRNDGKRYIGFHISLSESGSKYLYYSFQKVSDGNGGSAIKFKINQNNNLVPSCQGLQQIMDVEYCLTNAFQECQAPSVRRSPIRNFNVTVYLGLPNNNPSTVEYLGQYLQKVEHSFQIKGFNIQPNGTSRGPLAEATMLYYGSNFDCSTNTLKPRNIIKLSSNGITMAYVTSTNQLKNINGKKSKPYYAKLGGSKIPDVLFGTNSHCFSVETVLKLSVLYFISISELNPKKPHLVKNHPCLPTGSFSFAIANNDKLNVCLKGYIGTNIKRTRYRVDGAFYFEGCIEILKNLLKRSKVCETVALCWLNFDEQIFANPTIWKFYLTGDMYNVGYSARAYNFFELRAKIFAIVTDIQLSDPYENVEENFKMMYIITLCQMLAEAIDPLHRRLHFQASELDDSNGPLFLDRRLWDLLAKTQLKP